MPLDYDPNDPNAPKIWEQLAFETDEEFRWFIAFRDVPFAQRTIFAAYLAINGGRAARTAKDVPPKFIAVTKKNEWEQRARAYDSTQLTRELLRNEEFARDMSLAGLLDRHNAFRRWNYQLGMKSLQLADRKLRQLFDSNEQMSARDLKALLELGRSMLQAALGGAKSIEEVAAEARALMADDPEFTNLSDEEQAERAMVVARRHLRVVADNNLRSAKATSRDDAIDVNGD